MGVPLRRALQGMNSYGRSIRNKTQRKAFLVFTDDQGNFSFTNGKVTLRVLLPLSKSNRENDLKVLVTERDAGDAVALHIFEFTKAEVYTDKAEPDFELLYDIVSRLFLRYV